MSRKSRKQTGLTAKGFYSVPQGGSGAAADEPPHGRKPSIMGSSGENWLLLYCHRKIEGVTVFSSEDHLGPLRTLQNLLKLEQNPLPSLNIQNHLGPPETTTKPPSTSTYTQNLLEPQENNLESPNILHRTTTVFHRTTWNLLRPQNGPIMKIQTNKTSSFLPVWWAGF